MATAAPPAPTARPGVQPLRAGQGHSYLLRKLHSLSGIVPIGAFLVEHIVSNFETWNGPVAYAKQVLFLNSLPLVRVLEWGLIFIPLAFHALYGVFIAFRGRSNVNVYPWAGNWGYYMQRVTGIIALAYIIQHVWRERFAGVQLPEHPGAAFHKVQIELHNPWMLAIYIIAMIATMLALRLRHLALRRQVGHHARQHRPQALRLRLRRRRHRALRHGPDEHLRRRREVPERAGRCHAGAAHTAHLTNERKQFEGDGLQPVR